MEQVLFAKTKHRLLLQRHIVHTAMRSDRTPIYQLLLDVMSQRAVERISPKDIWIEQETSKTGLKLPQQRNRGKESVIKTCFKTEN